MSSISLIRNLVRPASTHLSLTTAIISIAPAVTTVQHTHAVSATAPFSTTCSRGSLSKRADIPAAQRRAEKLARLSNKNAKTPAKARKPAPGDRKAFRKRIVLSNSSALPVSGLATLEPDTLLKPATEWSEPPMVGLSGPIIDQLRALEAFRSSQNWDLFHSPHFLARKETFDLAARLSKAQEEKKAEKIVVVGPSASGKSSLLLQSMAHALANNWIVINIPEAQDLVTGNTEYSPIPNTNPIQFTQPVYMTKLLESIYSANEAILKKLPMSKDFKSEFVHIPATATLADLATASKEADTAWPIFIALWAELASVPGRPPILLATDGLNHLMKPSAYRDPSYKPVHAHDLALPRFFLDVLGGRESTTLSPVSAAAAAAAASASSPSKFAFTGMVNGGAVIGALCATNAAKNKSLDLSIAQNKAAATAQSAAEIPQRDPYEKTYDGRVFEALAGVSVLELAGISRPEARSVIEYWASSGLIRTSITNDFVAEKWTLGGGGMIGEVERATLRTMRM